MAFPPRPPLMTGLPVSAMVGTPFTLGHNLVQAVRLPMGVPQSLSSVPTPMGARPPMRPIMPPIPPLPSMPRPPMPPGGPMMKPTYSQRIEASGPAVTVFVGNITERAPDVMIRHILNACGPVLSWKRVQGASGKLQGFGFCEYGNPDAALRAIRLLHNYEIATNRLVVKADSKTTEVLSAYKEKRRKAKQQNGEGNESPLQDEKKVEEVQEDDDYLDEEMKVGDRHCLQRVVGILSDHKKDIVNYIPPHNRQDLRNKRMSLVQEKIVALSSGADLANIPSTLNLDDMEDVEEGKKELISREITQFREQMKKQEEEKERERKLREKDRDREKERFKEREKERDREREWERERERERRERDEKRRKSRSGSRSGSVSVSRRSRSPSSEVRRVSRKEKRHSRSRSHSPSKKNDKELWKDREKEEEDKERKEQERKVRKKELQYQERLKNWEAREHKKQKELERDGEKEKMREVEREKEARRLKEFLEDYDDERDDPKYYKGHAFQRKLMDRDMEKEVDAKDRVKEKEELEELRVKILQEGHDNPEEAFEQACAEREEQYKPKLILKPNEKPLQNSSPLQPSTPQSQLQETQSVGEPASHQETDEEEEEDDDDDDGRHSDGHDEAPAADQDENSFSRDAFSSAETTPQAPKRKKLDIKDVFNQEDDEDTPRKKKKLPLPGKEKGGKEKGGEEKRKHIKSLIDKIPTSKEELFAYPIDASLVDSVLMEKRIRPWINKKIIEYIGEPEPTLVDFICSKVLVGSEPESLLNDVQMVLDDEAEVFVVKMWRLLIYEIEAKKMGLGKS